MKNPTGKKENAVWPMPQFHFRVTWGSAKIQFAEISGLDSEEQIIEYRHGDGKMFHPIKMPGLGKVSNITMKRGVFVGDNTYWDWFNKIKLNEIENVSQTVMIQLLNEKGQPTMNWTLNNARAVKITSAGVRSNENSPAIDEVDVVFETLSIGKENNP